MVNSISGGSGSLPLPNLQDAGRGVTATDSARPAATEPARLSGRAMPTEAPVTSRLERMAADLAAAPPVDSARVTALKLAVDSGSYRPDPARIAEAMIAQESTGLTPAR
jgi:negative regulator of flagellin synthesis FlgM